MGSEGKSIVRKPRFLCLHGFRTSAEIMKIQLHKWPKSVIDRLDLVFLDAPFPCQGKSDVEGIFDPPYYEWFQFNKEFTEYTNFEKCLEYLEDRMIKLGPFDGLIGFSQGAILSGGLPGLQAKGIALQKVPKIKFVIIIGGAKLKSAKLAENAYSSSLETLSLHFLGETDFLKPYGTQLIESYKNPVVVHHPKGHTVPRLDDKSLEIVTAFIDTIEHQVMEEDKNGEESNSKPTK
ncbi:Alpha/Beta hydrolase fold [Arabidopsis thaliana x Arabidopsis arenosa]|uniref:Alpha/Beta hydrolase fold n=1 Tax=Arabidopsis thaliana x Arabidopsis arenosa TaxID=1240361 RepID=A0A8T1Y8C6_9BRAS|nr:Alpha/Beta hydrolase fold [Arabidopsis thaliana x Arabidopsis arenosa]